MVPLRLSEKATNGLLHRLETAEGTIQVNSRASSRSQGVKLVNIINSAEGESMAARPDQSRKVNADETYANEKAATAGRMEANSTGEPSYLLGE